MLTRQLQEEERDQALKQNKQVEYDVPSVHHIDRLQVKVESKDEQLQGTDYKPFVRSFTAYQAPNYHDRSEIKKPHLKITFMIFSGEG